MPTTPLIIAGKVFSDGTTIGVNDIIVTVKNRNTLESHNGEDSSFPELTTNSNGEWLVNLSNYDLSYSIGDILEITLVKDDLRDLITVRVDGSPNNTIVLIPRAREPYNYERALDRIGDVVTIYRITKTYDDDYGSVETETQALHPIRDRTIASLQPEEEEKEPKEQGIAENGLGVGYFKTRYNIQRGDKIVLGNDEWIVQDQPVRRRGFGQAHHDEAIIMRVND